MSTTSHIPANEPERLTALAPYRVLGTSPDAVFDEIVRLTAKLFNVPIALIALVDEASVWFKANFGMIGTEQIARDESVCSIAIRNEDTTIFNDLRETPCALAKPHVAESLQLRFYAGHPLRNTQGYNIGALCVIDRKPRQLSTEEQKRLQELAGIVMKMLDLRLALMRRPELASTAWIMLYDKLDTSLNRLNTLAELARWEESPTTPVSLSYQQARADEIQLITHLLAKQVDSALAAV